VKANRIKPRFGAYNWGGKRTNKGISCGEFPKMLIGYGFILTAE
jgi:hypothetical protein